MKLLGVTRCPTGMENVLTAADISAAEPAFTERLWQCRTKREVVQLLSQAEEEYKCL